LHIVKEAGELFMDETSHLWEQLKLKGDEGVRGQIIEAYLPLVRQIATMVLKKLRSGVELDDLISDGTFGLMRAVENFDLSRGFKFETYATPVIRGAIYNGLRSMDWVPERTRGKARNVQKTSDDFFKEHGRTPTHDELADELKITSDEVYDIITSLGCIYILSLDQPITSSDDDETSMLNLVENEEANLPLMEIEFEEEREHLRQAIVNLDERDRYIITRHYFEGVTFESISEDLGVTKQRISQLHTRAITRLKEYLGRMNITDEAMKSFTMEEQNILIPPRWKQ
jgi:RNA polymerase sigma factor FliA